MHKTRGVIQIVNSIWRKVKEAHKLIDEKVCVNLLIPQQILYKYLE